MLVDGEQIVYVDAWVTGHLEPALTQPTGGAMTAHHLAELELELSRSRCQGLVATLGPRCG